MKIKKYCRNCIFYQTIKFSNGKCKKHQYNINRTTDACSDYIWWLAKYLNEDKIDLELA